MQINMNISALQKYVYMRTHTHKDLKHILREREKYI